MSKKDKEKGCLNNQTAFFFWVEIFFNACERPN
jgi:hypothetical protein